MTANHKDYDIWQLYTHTQTSFIISYQKIKAGFLRRGGMHLHPESHMDADSISLGLYSECGRGEYFDSFSYFRLISGSTVYAFALWIVI